MISKEEKRKLITKHHGGFIKSSDAEIDRVWAGLAPAKRNQYLQELASEKKQTKGKTDAGNRSKSDL